MNLNNGIYKYAIIVIICVFNINFIQGQGISSTNSNMIEKHTGLPSSAFYNQQGSPTGYDPGDTNAVTIEAEGLVLTSSIRNSLNQGGSYIQYEGSLTVGDAVNVYMVYLNHDGSNFRNTSGGIVTFDNEILGVYVNYDEFKHFTGSSFSSSYYDSSPSNDMHFEPGSFNGGSPHSSWTDTNDKDWYTVTNSNKTFTMGCKNGLKGDFFRLVTKACTIPTANAGSNATIDCNNTSATIGASAVSGLTYAWTPSTGLSNSTIAQPTATPNTTTTYSLVVTNASGCESTADTVVVTVDNAAPTANAGSNATIDCNNTSAVIGAPAVSGFTYAWTPSTGLNGQYAHPTATPNTTTTYTLVITNSSTGCTDSDTVVVTVDNATPSANAGSDGTIDCNTTSVSIGASAVSGFTYAWTPTTGLSSSTSSQPTATPTSTTTYSLVATKASTGCASAADTVVVTVDNATPTANAGSDGTIDCNTTSVSIGASAVSGFTYAWTPTTGLSSSTSSQPTATPTSTTTYSLAITNSSTGCTSTDTVLVTVDNAAPTANAGSNATIDCNTTSVSIGASAVSGFTYAWTPTTGLSSSTSSQPTATPTSTTTYSLVATKASTGCASAADTVVVTVDNATPTSSAGSDTLIGCSVTSVSIGSSAVSGFTYAWTPTTGLSSSTSSQPTATPTSTTTYSLVVTKASTGCSSAADTVVVTVDNATPTANAGTDGTITCSDTSVSIGSSAVSGFTYAWTPTTGLSSSTVAQPVATPTSTTTYSLVVTKASTGCSSTADTVLVTVEDLPTADAGTPITIDCSASSVSIGASAVSGFTYAWTPTTGLSSSTSSQPTATPSSTTTYSLVTTEASTGCSSVADTVVVTVEDTPIANAGSNATIDCNTTSVSIGSSAVSGFTYAWTPSTGLSSSTAAQPIATPSSTTTYSLVVTKASTGCSSVADTVVITVDNDTPTAVADSPVVIDCTVGNTLALLDGTGSSSGLGYTYSWTTLDGIISGAIDSITSTATLAGTYTLKVTETATGCESSTVVVVVAPDQEIANISYGAGSSSYCTVDSDPTPSIGANGTSGGLFSATPVGLVINNTTGEIDLSASTPGIYAVSYITSSSDCGVVDQVNIEIISDCDGDGVLDSTEIINGTDPSNPCDYNTSDITLTQTAAYLLADCDGDGVTNGDELTPPDGETPTDPSNPCDYNTSDITLTQTAAYLLADCDGDGVTNGDELTPPDGETPTDPSNPCDFNTADITLTVTSTVGCNAEISVTKIANNTGTGLGDTIYYTIVVENTGSVGLTNITLVDVFLNSNGNSLSLTTEPYFISSDLGSVEGMLLVGENATYMADFDITQEAINAGGVSNSVIVTGTTVNSVIVTDYSDNGDDLDGNTNDDPTETNLEGCLIVYSEFSPNGDGVNDNFVIGCIDNYPNNNLEIYNRWGNIVYKMNGYNNDWNGASNGRAIVNDSEDLPEGTYYYKLELGDGSLPKIGWLYLNR